MSTIRNSAVLKNQGMLVRILMPVAAIGLSAFLASRIDSLYPVLPFLLAGIVALAGVALAVRFGTFQRGIVLVMLTAGLVNFFTLPTGRDSKIVISLALSLLMLFIWGGQLIFSSRTRQRIRPSPINKPLLFFVGVNIVSYVWSLLIRDPLLLIWPSFPLVQIAALLVNISLPLMALLAANKMDSAKWLQVMLWTLVGLGVVNIVSRLFNLPSMALVFNGSLGIFPTCVVVSAYSLVLFHKGLRPWHRLLLIALIGASLYYYFVQNRLWLSGWVPMFVGIAVVTFIKSRRLFVVLMLAGTLLAADRLNDLYETIVVANVDEGGLERIALWETNINHVLQHPLFGSGPGGYAVYYMTYNPGSARSTHNNLFDVLAQSGILGLATFMVMMGTFLVIGYKTLKHLGGQPASDQGKNMTFAAAGMAVTVSSLVAMLLGDWILPFAYNQTITGFDSAIFGWLMMGGVVALYHITGQKVEATHA